MRTWARSISPPTPPCGQRRAPSDGSAWARLGRLRLRLGDRDGAIDSLEQARVVGPSLDGLLDLALAYHLAGDVGGEVSAAHAATVIEPDSSRAWSTYAHAAGAHGPPRRVRGRLPRGAGPRGRRRGLRSARAGTGDGASRPVAAQRGLSGSGRRHRAPRHQQRSRDPRAPRPAGRKGRRGRRLRRRRARARADGAGRAHARRGDLDGQLAAAIAADDGRGARYLVGRAQELPLLTARPTWRCSCARCTMSTRGSHAALREARRVLRSDGAVYVAEPLPEGDFFELTALARTSWRSGRRRRTRWRERTGRADAGTTVEYDVGCGSPAWRGFTTASSPSIRPGGDLRRLTTESWRRRLGDWASRASVPWSGCSRSRCAPTC